MAKLEEEPKQPATTEEPEPAKQPENSIPYERFKQVNDSLKAFKSLGFESPDQIKSMADELSKLKKAEEEREKAKLSETERLQSEKEEATKKAEDALKQLESVKSTANQQVIAAEIRSIARAMNANDPADVYALIDKNDIKIEDGKVAGAEDAVKAIAEAKPWLFKKPQVGADVPPAAADPKRYHKPDAEAKLEEAKEKAKSGRPADLARYISLKRELESK